MELAEKAYQSAPGGTAPSRRAKLSLIVPVLNEQAAIPVFVSRLRDVLGPLAPGVRYEILFVNDGSTDATEFIIRSLMQGDPSIRLINLSRNVGKDAALCAGIVHAAGDAVIPIDVDLQDDPEVIPQMIDKWRAGARVVNARRVDRSRDTSAKRLTSQAFYRTFNFLADHPIPVDVGDFRLLDRQVVDILRSLGERSRFNKALFSWVGFETDEVTFERPARSLGQTSWNYWKLWNFALDGIFTSSTRPLRVWTYVGTSFSLLGFFYAAYVLVLTLIVGRETPGYASTVILILLFGGLQLIAIGIVGEYVGRIFTEVRDRPLFIVRSMHGERVSG